MASLIPAIGSCVSRMTGGEKRLAYRLESKLEDDWLIWYDVPLGPRNAHPDFVVFNPRRGLLVLEVKDWRLDTPVSSLCSHWGQTRVAIGVRLELLFLTVALDTRENK